MQIYLKKLELHGFKSFPEKTVVQFHRGITAVIGPNGCGKSNLVDALLWVLGEQRIKNLRGENNEDLIFTGSASKKPLGMTEVGAYFANHDADTYIARRFFRSGESKYILNEKFCRNKDVQDTLFDLGIGERNYFIFEQGSVEKMVNLKPSERRILIEEAAGIAQYLERKKETAGKLIIAQQNLDSLELVLQEKNNRLRELKNQVHFARRYREIKNSRNDLLKALLQKKYQVFKEDFDLQGGRIVEFMNGEAAMIKEIGDFDHALLELEGKRWNLDQSLKSNQQFIFDHNNKLLEGSKEVEKTQQRQEFIKQKIAELDRTSAEGEAEIKEIEKQDKVLAAELAGFDRELAGQSGSDRELDQALEAIRKASAERNIEDGHLKKAMFSLQVEISRNRNESAQLEKNLLRLEGDVASRRHIIQELQNQGQDPEIAQGETAVLALAETCAPGKSDSGAAAVRLQESQRRRRGHRKTAARDRQRDRQPRAPEGKVPGDQGQAHRRPGEGPRRPEPGLPAGTAGGAQASPRRPGELLLRRAGRAHRRRRGRPAARPAQGLSQALRRRPPARSRPPRTRVQGFRQEPVRTGGQGAEALFSRRRAGRHPEERAGALRQVRDRRRHRERRGDRRQRRADQEPRPRHPGSAGRDQGHREEGRRPGPGTVRDPRAARLRAWPAGRKRASGCSRPTPA